jgi:hypothetical protein
MQNFNDEASVPAETSMPSDATRSMFLVVAGFGIGALVVLGAFTVLIGVGEISPHSVSPALPAAQSAANQPANPGPAPKPAPDTASPAAPKETTGSAPAPANPATPRSPTRAQQQAK